MLDLSFVRSYPEIVKASLKKRREEEKVKWIDEIVKLDKEWRALKQESDNFRQRRNTISEEINKAKKAGKNIEKLVKEAAEIPARIKLVDDEMKKAEERIVYLLQRIPNVIHESVPVGKDSNDNVEIRKWGKPKKPAFELKSHGEWAENLGLADFRRAAKVSGAGFYFLKGKLAQLDLALQLFAIKTLAKKGYTLVQPPMMLRRQAYEGVVSLADFENVMYKIDNEDLYAIATSEHPLISQYMNEVLDEKELPIKLVGVSSCFRKEIGSHGVDTRGLFRVHQFNKIEQIIICKPEDSWDLHEELQKNAEELFKELELPYRVVNICTGDLGMIAAKKYDIEVWSPRQGKYVEVTSASNCTNYQAAGLNLKYQHQRKGELKRDYVHTLNATAIATGRALVAIIENFQNKDGSVDVPKALQKYTGFKKIP